MTYTTRKELILNGTDYDGNISNFRAKNILAAGGHRFTCKLPQDLKSLISFEILGNVSAGAALVDRDIDFSVDAHQKGQPVNQKTASDTTTLYNLSTYSGKTYGFNLTSLIPTPTAGDLIGIFIDHKGIGGNIYYFEIDIIYNSK